MKVTKAPQAKATGLDRAGATEYPSYAPNENEKKFKAVGARAHGAKVAVHPTHESKALTAEDRRNEVLAENGVSESE